MSMLYEKVAEAIEAQIDRGLLKAGDRVPSVRHMSLREGVSVSTVIQSYMLLEQRGLLEAKPQSGFYVRMLSQQKPLREPDMQQIVPDASPVAVNDLVYEMLQVARDPSILPLGAAGPSPELFPEKQLNRILRAILREEPHHSGRSSYPPGLKGLRTQIARRSVEAGCLLSGDDIVITSGAFEAVTLCLRAVTQPGDAVAVESPTHFSILQMIESLNLKAVEIPSHPRTGLDLKTMEWALENRTIRTGIFMPNFSNPLGSLMSDEAKKELVNLFADRNLPIIEDDIEGDLAHSNVRPKALKAFDQQGLVLWCSSFSKTISPGFRLGWSAPGQFRKAVEKLKYVTSMASPSLSELVIWRYLESGSYDRHLRRLRRAYATQINRVRQAVCRHFPSETKITQPCGGFVLWVELPKKVDSLEFYRKALAEKISITPGTIFSPSGLYSNCIRLNCGQIWSARMEAALVRLGEIAHRLSE